MCLERGSALLRQVVPMAGPKSPPASRVLSALRTESEAPDGCERGWVVSAAGTLQSLLLTRVACRNTRGHRVAGLV